MIHSRRPLNWYSTILIAAMCSMLIACNEDDETSYPEYIANGCEKIAQHCLDEDPWRTYVESASQCEKTYRCTYDDYSSSCRSRLEGILECAENIDGVSACDDCSKLVSDIQTQCPYPQECFQ